MGDQDDAVAVRAELLRLRYDELIRDYSVTFGAPSGQRVLADLVDFCFGTHTCVVPGDVNATLVREGRREVLLRIMQFAKLDAEEIFQLAAGRARFKGAA